MRNTRNRRRRATRRRHRALVQAHMSTGTGLGSADSVSGATRPTSRRRAARPHGARRAIRDACSGAGLSEAQMRDIDHLIRARSSGHPEVRAHKFSHCQMAGILVSLGWSV